MLAYIESAVIVLRSHDEALRRAHGGTQAAKHALAHVDVEGLGVNALGCAVRCLAKRIYRPNGHYFYTIDRTHFRALVTYDAIIYFIMQLVSAMIGHGNRLMRKLERGGAERDGKKIGGSYVLIALFRDLQ